MRLTFNITIFLIAGIWLVSCRSIEYVPVETVRTKTEYRDHWLRDSIHVRDSVFMFAKGDTIYRERFHAVYKDRLVKDTTYINKTDTIRIPYPVDRQLSRWESIKMELGGWGFGVLIMVIVIIISRMMYRKRIG